MASIYKHRDGWQACASLAGVRKKKNFPTEGAAKKWARTTEVEMERMHHPALGGPSKVTLAGMLMKYAHQFTVSKKSCKSELDRINRYLDAAGMPLLQPRVNENGSVKLVEVPSAVLDSGLPPAFIAHRTARRDKREKTNALRAQLACTLASSVSKDALRSFMAQMQSEGLGGSTALKEMALLKHCFNMAIKEWSWVDFQNPLAGMKLPKPAPSRTRVFADDEEARLRSALAQCDNPFILPLFEFALETAARRGSLLKLQWRDIDIANRHAMMYDTKGGHNHPVPLTQRALDILERLPRGTSQEQVFATTASALTGAWKRACARAAITDLHFHDGRHESTSRHAKRLRSPHMLMKITGHLTVTQLSRYVHFMSNDLIDALDATEPAIGARPLPPNNAGQSVRALASTSKASRLNANRPLPTEPLAASHEAAVHVGLPVNVFSIMERRRRVEEPGKG